MGNSQSLSSIKISYEDVQYLIKNSETHLLINTLAENEQHCLIKNTMDYKREEELINKLLNNSNKEIKIIIYGRNCNDDKLHFKYNQLTTLGFCNVYVYTGGLFEWLLLQDIYGENEFPTTKKEIDILKYKPRKLLNIQLLEY